MKQQSMDFVQKLSFALIVTLSVSVCWAAAPYQSPDYDSPKTIDYTTFMDINQLLMFATNTGSFAYDKSGLLGRYDGLYYPRGTNKTLIYASGLWVGATVGGQVRVAISEYSDEYVPGTFGSDQLDPRFHVYKINQGDSPGSNPDYATWPFADGAPALKAADGTDSLDIFGNRIPLILGDQTLWSVFNDGDPGAHTNNSGSTAPLDIEVQNTAFASNRSGALGQILFLRWKIKNTGASRLDDAYISAWADPDLGDANDDLAGCDVPLNLGYVYNDGSDNTYGAAPPAVGFVLLQGPVVPGGDADTARAFGQIHPRARNIPMTAFTKYINGTDPNNAIQTYNYMRGLDAAGGAITDPWGNPTTYMFSGDPVAGTGWFGGYAYDCRYMISTGPVTLAPGDSQEVAIAVCVGQGADPLLSVTSLRETAVIAQAAYDALFEVPPGPPAPEIVLDILPGQCPNILLGTSAISSLGMGKTSPLFPVADDPISEDVTFAICGTPDLDVHDVDYSSLHLAGLAATGVRFRDVTSVGVPDSPCYCLRGAPDGFMDLVASVNRAQLYEALGSPPNGDYLEVLLTGYLKDGRAFSAIDCMRVRAHALADIGFNIIETRGPGGIPVSPPDNVAYSPNSTGDWRVSSDDGDNFLRMDWQQQSTAGETWELRFNASGSEYYDWNSDQKFPGRAPFETWNLGINTPDDPSDDQRVQLTILDDDFSGGWSMGDRVYIVEIPYTEPLPQFINYLWPEDFHIGRIVFNDLSGNGRPADGTVVRFTAKTVYVKSQTATPLSGIGRTAVSDPGIGGARLDANYPNPFNAATSISYYLDREGSVTLEVFNVLGQRTRVLVDRVESAGPHAVTWSGKDEHGEDVASGMYFYRLRTDDGVQSRKMILLK